MHSDPDCVFCKIIAGTIPSYKLYDDAKTMAFLDINPINPGHALVIPKNHAMNLFETADADTAAVMATVRKVATAIQETIRPYGMNLLQANGPGANQSVFHFHMHIIPRVKEDKIAMNWRPTPGNKDALAEMHTKLKAALKS
jgi:histidine triad (HIT) family protein